MKKYRLINSKTKKEHICEKIEIDDPSIDLPKIISDKNVLELEKKTGNQETIESDWDLKRCFEQLRFNKNTHLGLGDIRLTIGMQEEICKLVDRFYEKKNIRNYKKPERENSFSEEDMIDFAFFFSKYEFVDDTTEGTLYAENLNGDKNCFTIKELLEIWEKQKIKTIYYK